MQRLNRLPMRVFLQNQVFFNLLKCQSSQSDQSRRPQIRASLDILIPVIARNARKADKDGALWAKYMRRIMVEESSMGHMQLVWQLLVRHPDIFYPIR